jgi:hypothetical protein
VLCYIVALANMPIANVVALTQITPLIVLLGAALFYRERLSGVDLPLNRHPAAIRASAVCVTPWGAG